MSVVHRLKAAWNRLVANQRRSWERGAAEIGVIGLAGALVLGAAVGNGVARTAVNLADGLTWLSDDATGQVVQVNPATGRPENRLQIAGPDSELDVTQRDGMLLITDAVTGEVTAIDLATLLTSGRRTGSPGGDTKVVVVDGQVLLVDLASGVVQPVDQLTLDNIGSPYQGEPLADAVGDDDGSLWLLEESGELREMSFAPRAQTLVEEGQRPVRGAGGESRLVGHEDGVTVFAPEGGAVVQTGGPRDVAVAVPSMAGPVRPAPESPVELVPASLPEIGTVLLVTAGDVLEVDVTGLGCPDPGAPVVFADRVYVPCLGDGLVIVLGADGQQAGPDILLSGGGDPQLTVDDGTLIVSTAGGDDAVVVQPDGSTRVIDIGAGSGPEVIDPDAAPQPPVLPVDQVGGSDPDTPDPGDRPGDPGDLDGDRSTDPADSDPQQSDPRTDSRTDQDAGEPGTSTDDPPTGDEDRGRPDPGDQGGRDPGTRDPGTGTDPGTGDPGGDPGTGTDPGADGDPGTDPGTDVDPGVGTDPGADVDPGVDVDPGTDVDPGVDVDPEVDADPGVDADPEVDVDPGVDVDPEEELDHRAVNPSLQTAGGETSVVWDAAPDAPDSYRVRPAPGSTGSSATVDGGTTGTVVSGLVPGAEVTYEVASYVDDAQVAVVRTEPWLVPGGEVTYDPPTDATLSTAAGETVLSWTAPAQRPDGYRVEAVEGDGDGAETGAGTTSVVLTGLQGGTGVSYVVHAVVGGAVVATSEPSPVFRVPLPPLAGPRAVTAAPGAEPGTVDVSWGHGDASAPPESYRLTPSSGQARSVGGTTRSATLTGLAEGASVTVVVTAIRGSERVDAAPTAAVRVPETPVVPITAPTGVQAVVASATTVTVTWTHSGPTADGFTVTPVGTGAGQSVPGGGAARSFTFTGTPGETYRFTVTADRAGDAAQTSGQSPAVTLPAAVTAPGAPGTVAATFGGRPGASSVRIDVSWSAAAANNGTISEYRIAATPSGAATVGGTATTGSVVVECGAAQGVCYDGGDVGVTVLAVNEAGAGPTGTAAAAVPRSESWVPAAGENVASIAMSPTYQNGFGRVSTSVATGSASPWVDHLGTCLLEWTVDGTPGSQQVSCAGEQVSLGNLSTVSSVTASVVATSVDGTQQARSAETSDNAGNVTDPNNCFWPRENPNTSGPPYYNCP